MRIGLGFDSHALAVGRRLVLGGVEIPFDRGLAGHSDADVLVHAIGDALLGAAAEGDLGRWFPDTDPQFRDIASLVLLGRVAEIVTRKGYRIENLDAVVVAQAPRLAPYLPQMRAAVAKTLGVGEEQVNLKAKSPEGMGALGRVEGIAAQAVCMLAPRTAAP
jgi:2-C-methyl-D-erythritol 2,4-cyclodiphosphate synthase